AADGRGVGLPVQIAARHFAIHAVGRVEKTPEGTVVGLIQAQGQFRRFPLSRQKHVVTLSIAVVIFGENGYGRRVVQKEVRSVSVAISPGAHQNAGRDRPHHVIHFVARAQENVVVVKDAHGKVRPYLEWPRVQVFFQRVILGRRGWRACFGVGALAGRGQLREQRGDGTGFHESILRRLIQVWPHSAFLNVLAHTSSPRIHFRGKPTAPKTVYCRLILLSPCIGGPRG